MSKAPIRKVTAGALGGAIVTLLIYILKKVAPVVFNDLNHETAAALTTVVTFAISYYTPHAQGELPAGS